MIAGAQPKIRNGGADLGVWGRSPQLPEAKGLGVKPPAAGGTGVRGRSKFLHFFAKIA